MSEKAENVFAKMEQGQNVSESINSQMNLQERGALMKQICGAGNAAADGTVKNQFGDLEIVCKEQTAANGAKSRDIVDAHKGNKDIYDQPSALDSAMKSFKETLSSWMPHDTGLRTERGKHPIMQAGPIEWVNYGTRDRSTGHK